MKQVSDKRTYIERQANDEDVDGRQYLWMTKELTIFSQMDNKQN